MTTPTLPEKTYDWFKFYFNAINLELAVPTPRTKTSIDNSLEKLAQVCTMCVPDEVALTFETTKKIEWCKSEFTKCVQTVMDELHQIDSFSVDVDSELSDVYVTIEFVPNDFEPLALKFRIQ